jgi:hypothetical protein
LIHSFWREMIDFADIIGGMTPDPKFAKWLRWIEKIKGETQTLLINKAVHEKYLDIVKANPEIQSPSDFHEWTIRNYGSFMIMAVRRQLDTDSDVISLKRLLEELRDNSTLLTKEWFRTFYEGMADNLPIPPSGFADADFESNAGTFDYFDPEIAEVDLAKLDKLGKNIRKFANKKIAHNTSVEVIVTFNEINAFVEEFEIVVKKYILLFTASAYSSLTPTWQDDWEEIFTKPWIKPRQ